VKHIMRMGKRVAVCYNLEEVDTVF